MTKILLSGANGKMGHVIRSIVSGMDDVEIVAGIDLNTESDGEFPIYKTPSEVKEKADVLIDFSHPSVLDGLLAYAKENKMPAILATTGYQKEDKQKIEEASGEIPLFFSANMSLGINILIELVTQAAKILEDNFDIEIIEKHHNQKIDAPSGTALAIADAISASLSEPYEFVYDRHASFKKRGKKEIGIHAVRGGTIVGEHDVIFAGRDEIIRISHQANSKEIFAVGAVRAAIFMKGKAAGLYSMKDLVKS